MYAALQAQPLSVVVSILPQKYFVEQIGGKYVSVTAMVGKGNDPHSYEPKPSQLIKLSRSKLYFSLGGGEFEDVWLEKFKTIAKTLKVIKTDQGIQKLTMKSHHHGEEEHDYILKKARHQRVKKNDKRSKNNAEGVDPHIWLSPAAVKIQVGHIYHALVKEDPSHQKEYFKNYTTFISRLDVLSADIRSLFKNETSHLKFLTLHPSWGYFAYEFQLQQVAVEVEGKNPKPAQLQKIIEELRKENIKVLFTQPQFSKRRANIIANEIKGRVISLDPLAENWEKNLRSVAHHIQQAVQ